MGNIVKENSVFLFGNTIFENGAVGFIITFLITVMIAKIFSTILEKLVDHAMKKDARASMPFKYLLKILRTVIYVIATFAILMNVKPLQSVSTAILGATSVMTVVVGLAAQETFGNFIAGFFIVIYQPFHVGDMVNLPEKNISGTVIEITFRHTILNTVENTKIIVPNSTMNSAIVEDKAFGQKTYIRYLALSVAYNTDIDKLERVITDVVVNTDGVIDTRSAEAKEKNLPINITVNEFLDSGIQIRFPFTTKSLGKSVETASKIRKALLVAFRENGIEIPYTKIQILK
ncbi:mechanosensitive ion channel family protein [Solobacterium sp.]|uniref:mechanosensitive ion channel family protein n=1 Tax=Solobacterium sp. TaxID=2060878 RepID=UPI001CADC91E|nr:mechanosensitive ion channel family protein [Solobacterium sp.]MBF1084459.1 mechanosensitive ion channel family protein [Solobacterium sp.]MBF1100405.1 mechanosensitive ion channel family protein [Solobacterium sp.]MBF1103611.1 mechanosensitive ion channel family protein [Solobacterium sp.]